VDRLASGAGYTLVTAEGAGALTRETGRLLAAVRQARRGGWSSIHIEPER
jgi:hypothetical protein